jgi:actin
MGNKSSPGIRTETVSLKNPAFIGTKGNDTVSPLVIDFGSGTTKVGFSGGNPRAVFPTLFAHRKGISHEINDRDCYIGDEIFYKKCGDEWEINSPIQHGIVTNWDNLEKLLHHTFYNELRVAPEEHPALFSETAHNPKRNREQLTKILFETFSLPSIYMVVDSTLSLYCSGKTTGVILSSGDGVSSVVPIYNGHPIQHTILRSEYAGSDLTTRMTKILSQMGYTKDADKILTQKVVREVKENMAEVSLDYNNVEKMTDFGKSYELPDGQVISMGKERFECGEVLFQPSVANLPHLGIQEMLFNGIMSIDPELRTEMFGNIVLSGGGTMLKGFPERIEKEMIQMIPKGTQLNIQQPPERKYSVWIGGSILSSLSTFRDIWITKENYDETGPNIIHRKCP